MLCTPLEVHELVVDGRVEHLGIAVDKLLSSLPKAAILVGHTNLKSLGQRKIARHLPAWSSLVSW